MRAWRHLLFLLVAFFVANDVFAQEKLIVLTFDDGPRPKILVGTNSQPGLIGVLESFKVPAHFFMVGGGVRDYPALVRSMAKSGFLIENHSYGHENFLKLYGAKNGKAISSSLERASAAIFDATGRHPEYFRPPFWAINKEIRTLVENEGMRVVELENPDINTFDYDDHSKRKTADVLVERVKRIIASRERAGITRHVLVFHELPNSVAALQILIPHFLNLGYRFGTLDEFFAAKASGKLNGIPVRLASFEVSPIRAVYLNIDNLYNQKKIAYLENLIDTTELNAIVIDFKVDKPQLNDYMRDLVARFKIKGIYAIGRQVVLQDSYLARRRPDLAIRKHGGEFWHSGRKSWQRYWVDPASSEVLAYNIKIAQQAIDLGFDEINFDYIRFPSDGDMKDIVYPVWDGKSKRETMRKFYAGLSGALKSRNPNARISVDIFGEVFVYGSESGIGQSLFDLAEYFDAISPMAYPSHYNCGEFGLKDPTAHPYLVYRKTLGPGLKLLRDNNLNVEIRPWIQDFSFASIYNCGPFIRYGPNEVRAQIQAGEDFGVFGFMLWNAGSNYTKDALRPKP